MGNEKQVLLKSPITVKSNSMTGESKLIGIYKCGRSFRAFDAFGNWFTVSGLPADVQTELSTAIFQYNNLDLLNHEFKYTTNKD